MRKNLCIILFVLLLCAAIASAEPISILLISPQDQTTITEYTQSFIFGFAEPPADILNCSLIVNNEVKGFRNSLIMINNNKISVDLQAGDYTWLISCIDKSLAVIDSDTRALKVDLGANIKGGYEIFYNTNGLRSYVLTIAPGQQPVTLPAMKSGEDIDIVVGPKTYYLDILSIGININQTMVDIRDRENSKRYSIPVSGTQDFDLDNDKVVDVEILLKNVERGVNAYFVVTPYPAAATEETPEQEPTSPVEIPVETPETPVTQPEEQPSEQVPEQGQAQEEPSGQEIIREQEENTGANSSLLIPIILVIVLAVVLAIVLSSKAGKLAKKADKKFAGEKPAKKEMPEQEQRPAQQEKFDIIKSTGRKR